MYWLTAFAFSAALGSASFGGPPSSESVPGEVLVGVRAGSARDESDARLRLLSEDVRWLPGIDVAVVRSKPGVSTARLTDILQRQRWVQFVEPNFLASAQLVPNDPAFANQFNLKQAHCPEAWDIVTGSPQVIIAIVDTGVDQGHPELAGRFVPGWDFVNEDDDPSDDNGHGTLCAGIAAATMNNGIGLAGVAPDSRLMAVKVLGSDGRGSYGDIASGILYAAEHGANVISLSLAGTSSSLTLQRAVERAWENNCVVVAAAGNFGNSRRSYPAAVPGAIAVGSVSSQGTRSSFSNYGPWVQVAAPGENVYSTYPYSRYWYSSGTSMSTAFVAGQAALVIARMGEWTPAGLVRFRIMQSCTPAGRWFSRGKVNVFRSVALGTG
jgi:thermitase